MHSPVRGSQMFKVETTWSDLVTFFGFALSQLLSVAAVISEDGEGLRFLFAAVQ